MQKFKLSQYVIHKNIVYVVCSVYSSPVDCYDLLRVFPKENEPIRYIHASTIASWNGTVEK
jgi:hypothetical protein